MTSFKRIVIACFFYSHQKVSVFICYNRNKTYESDLLIVILSVAEVVTFFILKVLQH